MILDDFLSNHPHCGPLVSATSIIEVPVEMYPYIDSNGGWGPDWTETERTSALVHRGELVTENGSTGRAIYAENLCPPFGRMCMFRPGDNSFVLVHSPSKSLGIPSDPISFDVWVIVSMGTKAICMLGGCCCAVLSSGRIILASTFKDSEFTNKFISRMNSYIGDYEGWPRTSNPELDLINSLNAVCAAISLINCKNVVRREVGPSRQVRRAAERSGTLPPFSYSVLEITRKRTERTGSNGGGEPVALHWTRGHFKDYTARGLFGKMRGVYWWSPTLHGKADRISAHTYRVYDRDVQQAGAA